MSTTSYSIHDLIYLEVKGANRLSDEMRYWLREFEINGALGRQPDITLITETRKFVSDPEIAPIRHDFRSLPSAYVTRSANGSFTWYGRPNYHPRWWTRHLKALLEAILVTRGAVLLKACALDFRADGLIACGLSGSGKTTLAYLPFRNSEFKLLSDDLVIACANGELLGFRTPIPVYNYHLSLLPGELKRRYRAQNAQHIALKWLYRIPGASPIARRIKPLLFCHRSTTKAALQINSASLYLPISEVFPEQLISRQARSSLCFMLERVGTKSTLKELSHTEALNYLLALTYRHSLMQRYGLSGVLAVAEHFQNTIALLSSFLHNTDHMLKLTVSERTPPQELQGIILDTTQRYIT